MPKMCNPNNWQLRLQDVLELEKSPVKAGTFNEILRQLSNKQLADASVPQGRIVIENNGAKVYIESYLNAQELPQLAVNVLHPKGLSVATLRWKLNDKGNPERGYKSLAESIRNRQARPAEPDRQNLTGSI